MSSIAVNAITDASAGNTTTINGVTPNSANVVGKNLIINGAMQIAQRGTSDTFSNGNAGYKVADRWIIAEAGTESFVFDIAQSTDAPSGFAYSYKLNCTTADASLSASSNANLEQRIEAQDLQQLDYGTSNAKSLTLSFWVKSSKTGTYIAWFLQDDASRSISAAYTINSANTWEQKTITIAGDTSGQIDNNNGSGFRVRFILFAGTDYTSGTLQTSWGASSNNADRYVGQVNLADNTANEWYITGVKLEVGESATEFEHRPYGTEVALCQRYYQKFGGSTPYPRILMPSYTTNAYVGGSFPYVTSMRATPTGAFVGTWINQNTQVGSNSISTGLEGFLLYTQSSSTVGISGLMPDATGFITLSSEL